MTKATWNDVGDRLFEAGLDRGMLYVDDIGVVWNGLVSVEESPSGGDPTPYYQDGEMYLNDSGVEEFGAKLEAFYSPPEFDACDGVVHVINGLFISQQSRKSFGLSYRTRIGNDVSGIDYGYKIHLIYNALAAPGSKTRASLNDTMDPNLLSWDLTAKPVNIPGIGVTAHLTIDTTKCDPFVLNLIEDILYGNDSDDPRLPPADEVVEIFHNYGPLEVVDNGDGTWTASGNDQSVMLTGSGTFRISSSTADPNGDGTFTLSSL